MTSLIAVKEKGFFRAVQIKSDRCGVALKQNHSRNLSVELLCYNVLLNVYSSGIIEFDSLGPRSNDDLIDISGSWIGLEVISTKITHQLFLTHFIKLLLIIYDCSVIYCNEVKPTRPTSGKLSCPSEKDLSTIEQTRNNLLMGSTWKGWSKLPSIVLCCYRNPPTSAPPLFSHQRNKMNCWHSCQEKVLSKTDRRVKPNICTNSCKHLVAKKATKRKHLLQTSHHCVASTLLTFYFGRIFHISPLSATGIKASQSTRPSYARTTQWCAGDALCVQELPTRKHHHCSFGFRLICHRTPCLGNHEHAACISAL